MTISIAYEKEAAATHESPDGLALKLALLLLATLLLVDAHGQEPAAEARGEASGQQWSHTGLLRARDLSPFSLLRLDFLPAHTADAEAGVWTAEFQLAYQNTYVLSDNARDYLKRRAIGRRPLRQEDANAILGLPGDAYYFDGEVGLADLIVQRRLNDYWSTYLTIPYMRYGGGAFDRGIESFHDTFGFGQAGRDLVAKDQFQIVYDIGGTQLTQTNRAATSGFGDPVLGVRYSLPQPRFGWDIVVELAARSLLTANASCYRPAKTTSADKSHCSGTSVRPDATRRI